MTDEPTQPAGKDSFKLEGDPAPESRARTQGIEIVADERTTQDEERPSGEEQTAAERKSRWEELDEQDSPPEKEKKREFGDVYMGTGGGQATG